MTDKTKGNLIFSVLTAVFIWLGISVSGWFFTGAGVFAALWWVWVELGE